MSAPELELAATVTRGAVRCSAWLGVVVLALGIWWFNVRRRMMPCYSANQQTSLADVGKNRMRRAILAIRRRLKAVFGALPEHAHALLEWLFGWLESVNLCGALLKLRAKIFVLRLERAMLRRKLLKLRLVARGGGNFFQ